MADLKIELPTEYFPNPDIGKPLFNGSIYVGEVDKDPELFPVQVYAVQEDGSNIPVSQPISIGAGGVPLIDGSPVVLITAEAYSLRVRDRNGNQEYYFPATDGTQVFSGNVIIKYRPSFTAGDKVINVPDKPTYLNVIVNGLTLQQTDADYTYDSPSGNVTLADELVVTDDVEVQYGEIVSVNLPTDSFIPEFRHITDFVTDDNDDVDALISACGSAETVLFGGYTMSVDRDFEYPAGGVCTTWDMQNGIWEITNNATLDLTNTGDFSIKGSGYVMDFGLKTMKVTAVSVSQPSTLQVDNTAEYDVGDFVTTSWSNAQMPNTGTLNTISSKTATSITLTNQVLSTEDVLNRIPENALILNARFNKSCIKKYSTGNLTIDGPGVLQNMANAYAVDLRDTTEESNLTIKNVKINDIALDMFFFQGNQMLLDTVYMGRCVDIGKQGIVWGNANKTGEMIYKNVVSERNNRDTDLFCFPQPGGAVPAYTPKVTMSNCKFDARTDNFFVPRQLYDTGGNTLHFTSYTTSQPSVVAGDFYAENCEFIGYQRPLLGTTFQTKTDYTQDRVMFNNCSIDTGGMGIRATNVTFGQLVYNNCYIRGYLAGNTADEGVPETTYNDCQLRDGFPIDGFEVDTNGTTSVEYTFGQYVKRAIPATKARYFLCVAPDTDDYTAPIGTDFADTNYFIEVYSIFGGGKKISGGTITGDVRFFGSNFSIANAELPNRLDDSRPRFTSPYAESLGLTLLLAGVDATSTDTPDVTEWFEYSPQLQTNPPSKSDEDLPTINFRFEGTDVNCQFGGNESGNPQDEYKLMLKNLRSDLSIGDTSPLNMIGAFSITPNVNSEIKSVRENRPKQIVTDRAIINYTTASSSGSSTITIDSIDAGLVAEDGDWLGLNVSGQSTAYFYTITNVAGNILTVSPTLVADLPVGSNLRLIKHNYTSVPSELVFIEGTGSPVGSVTPDFQGQIYSDTSAAVEDRLWMAYGLTSTSFWVKISNL